MPKGVANERYTGEFKQMVVEAMKRDKISYHEAARRFEISDHHSVATWERIYLSEGPEMLYVERRGRSSKGRPPKFPKEVEEDLTVMIMLSWRISLGLSRANYYICKNLNL